MHGWSRAGTSPRYKDGLIYNLLKALIVNGVKGEGMPRKYHKVILDPQEEGGYTVTVPALPGCISEGDTYDEALANIQEAIALHIFTEMARY